MMDFSHLMASLNQAQHELPNVERLLACFDSVFVGESFPWDDIFNQPLSSKLDVRRRIPEPVYTDLVNWINREISDDTLSDFVVKSFGYISVSVTQQEGLSQYSNMSILAVLALILRIKPHVLGSELPYQGKQALPLTVWMIKQASEGDLHVGLFSWVHYLLPLLNSNPQPPWRLLILELVEIILAEPEALTKLENNPVWRKQCLVPPSSLEILLRLRFSAFTQQDTTRFVKIYGSLKTVALAGALKSKTIVEQIFTVSLRLAGEGNNALLAKEATEMAIWSLLTENNVCWQRWFKICKENRAASLLLLKTLLEKWNEHSLQLPSSSPPPEAMREFILCIFVVSMILAGEEGNNTVLAREATKIAIWSLVKNIFCWPLWRSLLKRNLEASLVILTTLVHDFEAHSPKLSSSSSGGMTKFIVELFYVSLILAGEGNPSVARKAVPVAIWALTKNIAAWRHWYDVYEENLKASLLLLETLVQDGKYDLLKLSSSDTLTIISLVMKSFLVKNNEGITAEGANANLYKEADNSCKVILGRLSVTKEKEKGWLSPGNCSRIKGACTDVAVVLLLAVTFYVISDRVWFS